jgi:hypothetical protein
MRTAFVAVACSAVAGFWAPLGFAQQKTVQACRAEWQANKSIYQPKGITEQDYVDECRSFRTAPTTTPAAAEPAPKPKPKPTAAPAQEPASRPTRIATPAPARANERPTEAQAKARCRSDTVVWANLGSKIYHYSVNKDYGNTKDGAYMCEKDATGQGFRASKTERSGPQ